MKNEGLFKLLALTKIPEYIVRNSVNFSDPFSSTGSFHTGSPSAADHPPPFHSPFRDFLSLPGRFPFFMGGSSGSVPLLFPMEGGTFLSHCCAANAIDARIGAHSRAFATPLLRFRTERKDVEGRKTDLEPRTQPKRPRGPKTNARGSGTTLLRTVRHV